MAMDGLMPRVQDAQERRCSDVRSGSKNVPAFLTFPPSMAVIFVPQRQASRFLTNPKYLRPCRQCRGRMEQVFERRCQYSLRYSSEHSL